MLGSPSRIHRRPSHALQVWLGSLVVLSILVAGPARAATFTVNSTGDQADNNIGNGTCSIGPPTNACTLRAAIQEANGLLGTDIINFNIGAGGPQTITLTAALPFVSQAVTINGTTQPGFAGTPIIELSAAACGAAGALDLRAGASGSTIRGLVINRCPARAIRLLGSSNNVIAGNFLGTNLAGTAALANNTGVYIGGSATGSNNNRVGGTALADRNVISGNTADGVQINGGTGGADSNRVEGNYIGLDVTGSLGLGNGGQGIGVFGANANTNNVIGGTVAGARNVISGNTNDGVLISGALTTGNLVEGNFIGTDAAGTGAIPNRRGIEINTSAGLNTIGGPPGFENVISGNTDFGILIDAGASNTVAGNYIGTNAAGAAAVANGIDGIFVTNGASNNVIGGTTAAARNVVSGNTRNGIQLTGAATGNQVRGNYVGTDAAGTGLLGNVRDGVVIWQASNNTVGGTAAGAGNVIAGNQSGIYMGDATATGNVVQGNYVGTDAAGTAALPNVTGVYLHSANTTVGGTSLSDRNLISGNSYIGVWIDGSLGGSGNLIQGNFIGLSAGATALPNGRGVQLYNGSANNTIGGTAAGAGNTIAYNTSYGVAVLDTSSGNAILGNAIHSNGGLGIDLNDDGVTSNDLLDADTGPNGRQNFPVLTAAMTDGAGSADFAGSLHGVASTVYRIELFASGVADPSGYGEGQRYLGFTSVTTSPAGNATIGVILAATLTAGELVTATATDPSNNTSEFSNALVAVGSLVVTTTADTVDGNTTSVSTLIASPGADGRISLREAITAANNTAGADTIRFGIPLTDAGHVYYQDNGSAGSFAAPTPTTLADVSTPSAPTIPAASYDADYPAGLARSWYRIQPTSALPTISDAITIDASTQPLSSASGPVIELDGSAAGAGTSGLSVTTGPSTIRGLVVNRFNADGLNLRGPGGFSVTGNYVGTDVSGTKGAGNGSSGVFVTSLSGAPCTVGGNTPAARNVISGNGASPSPVKNGIYVYNYYPPVNTTQVRIQGNYIGTDVTGTLGLGVQARGIVLEYTGGHLIGGSGAGEGNLISGNVGPGIDMNGNMDTGAGGSAPTDNNVIEGNRIGTNAAGTGAIPNAGPAIQMYGTSGPSPSASGNTIRGNVLAASTTADAHGIAIWGNADNNLITGNFIGTDAGATVDLGNAGSGIHIEAIGAQIPTGNTVQDNVIRFNNVDGVRVLGTGAVATLSQNRIWTNDLLGIDLGGDGVTANDALDADSGPNNLLNFPTYPSPVETAGTLSVTYGLDVPAGWYRVEFFKNPSGADPSLHGEGQVFASSVVVSHPGGGRVAYGYSFAGVAGDVISATTTVCLDNTAACTTPGSTSEFSTTWPAVTTAVKLMSFTATARDRAVDLQWQTGSELDNLGFHLYRSQSPSGPWTRLTSTLIPGLGSSPIGKTYSFKDSGLTNGTRYYYRLEDVDTSSRVTSHGPISAIPTADTTKDGGDSSGKSKGAASPSCPDWVLAAYAPSGDAGSAASVTCTRHGDPEAVALGLVSRDSRQATLELKTGGFYALHEASGTVRVFVPGFDFPQDPQAPALPFRRALVEAVVGRSVQLGGVRAFDQVGFPGLLPAALGEAEMQVSLDGTVRAGRRVPRESSPQHVSIDLARLLPSIFQGETKSAVVILTPLRYDARRQQIVLAKRLAVQLLFTGREIAERGRGSRGRRERPRMLLAGELLARLYTTGRGLHAVPFEQLFSRRSRSLATSQLRLERQGQAQRFHVEPARDLFGPGSLLYFYADATASSTAYSSEVAWELLRAPDGVAMPLVSVAPAGDAVTVASTATASFESDRFYQPGLLDAPDPWLWDALASGATHARSFSLTGVDAASSQTAELDVFLQGASQSGNPVDHHVSVSLNGTLVGEAQFAGKQPYRVSLSVPVALLREAVNELSLTNVADTGVWSLVFLDRFAISYPQTSSLTSGRFEGSWSSGGTVTVSSAAGPVALLDVTQAPSWLRGYEATGESLRFRAEAGHRYLAVSQQALLSPRVAAPEPSTLRGTTNQADYLLIAPRAFLAAAEPLVARRADQGLTTRAVAFEEIVSEFGHGQPSAEAIKAFLAYAYQSWARPLPRYVLLLGDSTYDPRNFMGSSRPSPLPALWVKTSYLWTASDPELAAVNGEDELPDLAIGRLPATTVDEARLLVEKLIAWEDSGQGLAGSAVLVADNPDLAGDFEANARDIAQSFLAGRSELLQLRELGAETRPRIQDALDSGLSYLSYVGHGGAAVWASENVWNSWDAASLRAQSRQPLLVTMNCLNGYFVAPTFDSLTESLLKADGRGAIAGFSPSGLSLDGPAHQYHRALMAELTSGRHERLGDALLAAQRSYAQSGLMPELLTIYHLFGDPATKIR